MRFSRWLRRLLTPVCKQALKLGGGPMMWSYGHSWRGNRSSLAAGRRFGFLFLTPFLVPLRSQSETVQNVSESSEGYPVRVAISTWPQPLPLSWSPRDGFCFHGALNRLFLRNAGTWAETATLITVSGFVFPCYEREVENALLHELGRVFSKFTFTCTVNPGSEVWAPHSASSPGK